MRVDVSVWFPEPTLILPVTATPDRRPIGIRFGANDYSEKADVVVFLASAMEIHESEFMDTVSRCDQIIEVAQSVRTAALKGVATFHPGEEVLAVISDAEKLNDSEAPRG